MTQPSIRLRPPRRCIGLNISWRAVSMRLELGNVDVQGFRIENLNCSTRLVRDERLTTNLDHRSNISRDILPQGALFNKICSRSDETVWSLRTFSGANRKTLSGSCCQQEPSSALVWRCNVPEARCSFLGLHFYLQVVRILCFLEAAYPAERRPGDGGQWMHRAGSGFKTSRTCAVSHASGMLWGSDPEVMADKAPIKFPCREYRQAFFDCAEGF